MYVDFDNVFEEFLKSSYTKVGVVFVVFVCQKNKYFNLIVSLQVQRAKIQSQSILYIDIYIHIYKYVYVCR